MKSATNWRQYSRLLRRRDCSNVKTEAWRKTYNREHTHRIGGERQDQHGSLGCRENAKLWRPSRLSEEGEAAESDSGAGTRQRELVRTRFRLASVDTVVGVAQRQPALLGLSVLEFMVRHQGADRDVLLRFSHIGDAGFDDLAGDVTGRVDHGRLVAAPTGFAEAAIVLLEPFARPAAVRREAPRHRESRRLVLLRRVKSV
jgi:hypothetical protein